MATIVCLNAHPDDEALLSGGTIAMLAAEGHRVVLVVATDGIVGPADSVSQHPSRLEELRASAAVLGAARVAHLGYADSGYGPVFYPDPPDRQRFARADASEAADRLAAILREENAELLISYDPAGGYGHRDHIQVHNVGSLAAKLTGTRVLEATRPREQAVAISRVLGPLRFIVRYDVATARGFGTPRAQLTHRVDVRRYAAQKRAALAAHASQAWPTSGGRAGRAFWLLARLPVPIFALVLGTEWFAEPGLATGGAFRREVLN
ncbi:MAG: PIG-L family deacetylase [Nocardiopsaceae bacterium]|jgi:LmbE family N-acetylglucosaminyl deacetylase|nr:PIG-L family deacetylase [Nocardiopsaceae bacterium]